MKRPSGKIGQKSGRPEPERLLDWYDRYRRVLPWRAPPGRRADPYRVWLSEVMLQQTTVATVGSYFERFLERWPDVASLAAASLDDILHAWQGLGYYARARNLLRCAEAVMNEHGGVFPAGEAALGKLPGIGPYTAAAISAIAFDRPAVVVDGNVERVMARLFGVEEPLPRAKPRLKAHAAALTPEKRPGDYAQGVMDLGALVCTPKKPDCRRCPWESVCRARAMGIEDVLPRRALAPPRPTRYGIVFWAEREDGAVMLRRRDESGLLGGMMEVPSTPWDETPWNMARAAPHAPMVADWRPLDGVVQHTFTHFHLELDIVEGQAPAHSGAEGGGVVWCRPEDFPNQALPSVMKKVIAHARPGIAFRRRR